MILILLVLLLTSLCRSQNQLPSNVTVPFIFETEVSDIESVAPYYTDEQSYMEEEDKIYPRRWRLEDDGEEEKFAFHSLEDEGFVVYEVDGTRRPTQKIFGHFSKNNNSYLILAPVVTRPNSVYRLVVLLYKVDDPSKSITVKASMSTSVGNELTFAETSTVRGESTELMMKIPGSLPGPKLKLRVEAHQGANLLFVNTTLVHPSTEFLTIVIYMSRPAFTQEQQVQFRVLLLTHDMLPYQDPVDIFILDATGYVVKRWISRIPNIGLIDLDFFTPPIPLAGFWRVRVQAKSQVKDHPFLVCTYYIPRFELMYDFPAFILESEESIAGTVDAYVTNDATVFGNMTVTFWAKYPATAHDSHYKEITTEIYDFVDASDDFEFPMSLLEGHVPQLVGTEVKVTTAFMDHYTGMTVYGYAKSRIISGEVVVKFVGPSPVIFRPGMPLTLNVNVAYDDLEQIDAENLVSSSLKITSSVVLKTGGSVDLPEIYIPPESDDSELTEAFLSESDQNILKESLFGRHSFKAGVLGNTYYTLNNTDYFYGNEDWLLSARYRSIIAKETYIKRQEFGDFRETGVFTFSLEIPKDAVSLTVNAVYIDGDGATAGSKLNGIPNYHPNGRHLHVTSSTEKAVIGEYAVFHVRTNFPLLKFHYVVLSKGILVHSATEEVPFAGAEGVATLALAISREMFPLMTFLAYHVDEDGDINADFIKIPIDSPSVFDAELLLNEHKDHTKRTVEGVVFGPVGALNAISCAREISYTLQPTNRLTKGRFIEEALALEPIPRTVSKVTIQPRNRADPYAVKLKTSGDTEGDVRRTFQASGLAPLSDSRFESSSPNIGSCEISLGLLECGDGTCYQFKDICNGINNCEDGSDEIQCNYQYVPTRSSEEGIEEVKVYHLLRMSWWKDLFDTEDGSFAWATQFIDHGDNEQLGLEIPRTQDDWVVEGIAFHQHFGISFIEPQIFNSNPPVFLVLEGPTICRRGEQVSIRTAVFNSMPFRQAVLLVVPESEDYQFVYVEEKGIVDFFKPRLSTGEHQHFLPVPPDSIREVFLPFAIKKQVGTVEIVIKMRSPVAWDEETWEIEVKPEGAPVMKHTSVLLDLKSRAVFYEFLNIPINKSPIIKNSLLRRFVAGSPQASLSISGDVFGPTPEDISIHYDDAFKGRRGLKSTDGLAFNFGATLWTLHYMRLTNQLTVSEATGAFDFLNVQMAGILTRMINGGFKMWHYSGPSVWLTAWVTNLFQNAMFEEWENLIYVDSRVLIDSVNFMLQYQNPNGDFRETEHYNITLDSKYRYQKSNHPNDVSVGLTALVTATMKEVVDSLHGRIRKKANQAIGKAQRFLEKSLSSMDDPYDIAITAWALNMIGSTEKDVAVSKLLQIVRPQEGFLYWSKDVIKSNSRIFENNQRNFLQPKEPQEWDASSIEATSYALLVLLSQEGVTAREERIVNWLVSVRDWDFAFDATVDSIIAFRALTEYCYRARLRDVTDLKVNVEISSDPTFREQIKIEQPFVSAMQALEFPNAWGHVLLTGRGAGQALAQLTTTWGVDVSDRLEKPPRQYFTLYVNEYHHQARNKSRITTTVCTRWTATDFNPTSHAAMVEVEVPTGYFLVQTEANQVARKAIEDGNFPELKDVFCTEAYIFFQFSHIPSYQQCFKYDLHRWHPVANLTRTRSAMIFELFAPERFEQIILNTTTLSALDVCEVCGSYQCPYCPFFSSSNVFRISFILLFLSFIVTQSFVFSYDTILIPLSLIYDMFNRRIS